MIAAGVIGGLAAAVFGLIDWLAIPSGTRAKAVGMWHGATNVVMVTLFIASWLFRADAPGDPGIVAIVLSFVAVGLASLGGFLGGELVVRLGVGVAEVVKELGLSEQRLERLKTAVAEATMNAMEHGNRYRPEVPVVIEVLSSDVDLSVRINDQGGSLVPDPDTEVPDRESKLKGLQMPRGWGLFLIRNMVDEMHITSDEVHHTVGLVMHLEGGEDAG